MIHKIIGLFFILLFISSCSNDEEQTSLDYTYPLNVDNVWTYEYSSSMESFSSNETDVVCREDMVFYVTVTIDSMYNDIIDIYRFESTYTDADTSYMSGYSYYSNAEDGLYYLGGQGNIFLTMPTSNISVNPIINNQFISKSINSFPFDSTICWENPPLLGIQYPIVLNQQWNYREHICDDSSLIFKIDKVVTNINQDTFEITTLWGENFLIDGYNYHMEATYNSNGMIENRLEVDSIRCTDSQGNELGLFKEITQINLINSEITTD
tara:strand:- start:292 stop:1092 length:801 start_codon:yes stop_codon:yes gene_type:complete